VTRAGRREGARRKRARRRKRSHDFRAPLAALAIWIDVLRRDGDDPALRREALDAIDTCLELLMRAVRACERELAATSRSKSE
jgi:hypothetical protein